MKKQLTKLMLQFLIFILVILTFQGCINSIFFTSKYKVENACITYHKIDKYIDKGKIINKKYFPIKKNETILSIYEKIFLSENSYEFIMNSMINSQE